MTSTLSSLKTDANKQLLHGSRHNDLQPYIGFGQSKKNKLQLQSHKMDDTKMLQMPDVRGGPNKKGVSASQLPHDPNVHTAGSLHNMPVPIGMFMNMSNVKLKCYHQHQRTIEAAKQSRPAPLATGSGITLNNAGKRKKKSKSKKSQIIDNSTETYSFCEELHSQPSETLSLSQLTLQE